MHRKKTAVAFGSFDILHPGHIRYLCGAARYGKLTVVVARDRSIRQLKGVDPVMDERSRLEIVRALRFVDDAVLGYRISRWNDIYKILLKIKPDTIVFGYDQKVDIYYLKEFLHSNGLHAKIVRLAPYREDRFKSSKLKSIIASTHKTG